MCVVCEARMTLFHHLKLKRPRINSAPNGQMDESLDNAPSSDASPTEDPMVASDPSTDPTPSTHSEDDPDGMPQLERQNSVFDGGGGALPQLTPQHWPLSNTLAYRRHFSPSPPPPPLLMGERTMVWTVRGRAPPSSTVTSSPKRSPPETPSNSQQNAEVVAYHPTSSLARESISTTDEETSSTVSSVYPSWQDTQQQSPDTQALNLSVPSTSRGPRGEEEDGQPMICMICEDRATGLHYGIITCEGCKGFFKRTVQNKRVYSCVSDGNCEVTKAQRNRCQYCRFQKCVRQGMVLAAVREDRMPGGRNSGAVYNLYKVKYKKHRRGQRNGHATPQEQQQHPPPQQPQPQPASTAPSAPTTCFVNPSEWSNGQILKAALTRPPITAGRMGAEQAAQMIRPLVECDAFEEVARLRNARELLQCKLELNDKLCHIGDTIVYKLVQWTKRLPFYDELPVALHTQLLTHKWHELLVLTTCAFLAMRSVAGVAQTVSSALASLKECLTVMVGEPVGLEELQEAGPLVERLARLADTFRRIGICMEEYVCLKVIIMQSSDDIKDQKELEAIHDRYMQALQVFVEHRFPQQTTRFSDLLACIPEVQATASLVVQSKMFYVPLFLNTSLNKNDS